MSGVGLLTLLVGLAGCSNNIDIDPAGVITGDGYFTSVSDYDNALNSVYNRININNLPLWLDAVTDNGLTTHSWNRGYDIGRGNGNSSSSFVSAKWNTDYTTVAMATNIVNNIDKYSWPGGDNDPDRLRVLGEASTMRDYYYLDLVATYGNILFYTTNPATVADAQQMTQSLSLIHI